MLKEFKGGAAAATLNADISNSATTFTVNSAAGWPTGDPGPFVVAIEQAGVVEKLLCDDRTGTTFTVQTRAYDDTIASAFTSGATVRHVIDAASIAEANAYANVGHLPIAGGTLTGGLVAPQGIITELNPYIDAKVSTDAPNTYPEGLSNHFVNTVGTWPAQGIVQTMRDGGISTGTIQTLTSTTEPPRVFTRRSLTATTWGVWKELGATSLATPYPEDPKTMTYTPLAQTTDYTVPTGKFYHITDLYFTGTTAQLIVNSSITYQGTYGVADQMNAIRGINVILPEGSLVRTNDANSAKIHGHLVNSVQGITPVYHYGASSANPYTVPTGKRFVFCHAFTYNATTITIGGVPILYAPALYTATYVNPAMLNRPIVVGASTAITSGSGAFSINGYLVDA